MAKRKHYAVVGDDVDSDIEVEVDETVAVHTTTGQTTLHYHRHATKSAKLQPSGTSAIESTAAEQDMVDDAPETEPEVKQKKKQGASVMMEKFSRFFDTLQSAIISSTQYHRHLGKKCRCGSEKALYRCTGQEKCSDSPLRCERCIVEDHTRLPFHRIEKWTGTHFQATSLSSLGFVLCLGHYGHKCPNLSTKTSPRQIVAVHINGFHKFPVHFCHCENSASEAIQLAGECYFPGTMERPETMFSFGVLDNFHMHTLSSKKSLYDYHDTLLKMSNAAFPQDYPVSGKDLVLT